MDTISSHKQFILPVYANRGLEIVRGEGAYLIDRTGARFLDMMSNYGVNILGHNHPRIVAALKDQIDNLTNLHSSFLNETRSEAARVLVESTPDNLQKVYFASGGAETVESAIKFAALSTGRSKFLAAKNGYHGKSFGALSATTSSGGKYHKGLEDMLLSFNYFEFGSIGSLEDMVSEDTAAVVIEPIQGEGGIRLAEAEFFRELSSVCKKYGTLVIVDEIQSGLGRTGSFLASDRHGYLYDLLCLSKGLGGGLPTGVVVMSNDVADKIPRGIHTSTMGGNPLSMRGLVETINTIKEEGLSENARVKGNILREEIQKIGAGKVKEVRGEGLMLGIELDTDSMQTLQLMQRNGVIAAPSGSTVVRLLPPLIVQEEDIEFCLGVLKKVLR
jgi:acetylornithine/succinyldiaminopimelate/putrescine aminotransferase